MLAAAIRQVPARFRRKILIRVDGAGASHDLIRHLLSLSSPRRTLLFTCGWMITRADEQAIALLPADAWKPGIAQDGSAEQDKDVAEITCLMTRADRYTDQTPELGPDLLPAHPLIRRRAGTLVPVGVDASQELRAPLADLLPARPPIAAADPRPPSGHTIGTCCTALTFKCQDGSTDGIERTSTR